MTSWSFSGGYYRGLGFRSTSTAHISSQRFRKKHRFGGSRGLGSAESGEDWTASERWGIEAAKFHMESNRGGRWKFSGRIIFGTQFCKVPDGTRCSRLNLVVVLPGQWSVKTQQWVILHIMIALARIYGYPLVNVYITMENHHAINEKTHYFYGHFPVRFLLTFTRGYKPWSRGICLFFVPWILGRYERCYLFVSKDRENPPLICNHWYGGFLK